MQSYRAIGIMLGSGGIAIAGVALLIGNCAGSANVEFCRNQRAVALTQTYRGDLDEAEATVKAAWARCGTSTEFSGLTQALGEKKEQLRREADQRAKASEEEIAIKERAAVAKFPEESKKLRAELKTLAALVAANDLAKAAQKFDEVSTAMRAFRGTSVEKTESWHELETQLASAQPRIKSYTDELLAAVEAAKDTAAAQSAQDRRDGVKVTKGGYVAANTLDKLERAIGYATAKDEEGFRLFVQNDPDVTLLKAGVRVSIVGRGPVMHPSIRVRIRGTLDEFWTSPEALADP